MLDLGLAKGRRVFGDDQSQLVVFGVAHPYLNNCLLRTQCRNFFLYFS